MAEVNRSKLAFQITLHGGNVKDLSNDALLAAKEGEYEKAESLLSDAKEEYKEGHEIQSEVMREESSKETIFTDMLLAHALDHLMAAESEMKLIEEMVELHKRIDKLE